MKEFLLLYLPHPLWREHVWVFSVCVESEHHKRCLRQGFCFATQDDAKGCDYFSTWLPHSVSLTTWGWPRCHFPLLDPFVNISVCWWCGGVNIKFCFLYKEAREFMSFSFIKVLSQNNGSNNNSKGGYDAQWWNQLQEASGDLLHHQDATRISHLSEMKIAMISTCLSSQCSKLSQHDAKISNCRL